MLLFASTKRQLTKPKHLLLQVKGMPSKHTHTHTHTHTHMQNFVRYNSFVRVYNIPRYQISFSVVTTLLTMNVKKV
jgi:hypothetical protein